MMCRSLLLFILFLIVSTNRIGKRGSKIRNHLNKQQNPNDVNAPKNEDLYFLIQNGNSRFCLGSFNVSKNEGQPIVQNQCTGGDHQLWKLKRRSDGKVEITSKLTGLALEVDQGKKDNSALLLQNKLTTDSPNQTWDFLPHPGYGRYLYIRNTNSGRCITQKDGSPEVDGTIFQWDCNNWGTQQWMLVLVQ